MADYDDLADAFANGDVLYGLDGPRAAARTALLGRGHTNSTPVTKIILCCIRRTTGSTTDVLIQNDLTNAVWDVGNPTAYSSDVQLGNTLTDSTRGLDFRTFLSNHKNYDVAGQFRDDVLQAGNMDDSRTAWKRTSKGGLEFQTRSGRTVHFIIAGLAFDQIASKTGFGGKGNITSSEMRWLYRHRDAQEIQDNVRFWLPDREVPHKEVWSDSSWSSYTPNREVADLGAENTLRTALNVSWA